MSENEKSMDKSKKSNLAKDIRLELKRIKPERPQKLILKTEHYYNVKLPTYEESQKKYAKFLESLQGDKEKQERREKKLNKDSI